MFKINSVEEFIREDSRRKGGHFLFFDDRNQKPLALKYESTKQVRDLSRGKHLACVAMTSIDNGKYDLDFVVEGSGKKSVIRDILLHQVEGVPRLEWIKEGESWEARGINA